MKRTIYPTLVALAAAVALPAVLHAQDEDSDGSDSASTAPIAGLGPGGGAIAESPDGTMVKMGNTEDGRYTLNTDDYPPRLREDGESQMQKLLFEGPADGKHPVVIVNGARADEKALTTLTAALRVGKAHIREGSLQVLAGDDKEAAKYGTGANDKVIVVAIENSKPTPREP